MNYINEYFEYIKAVFLKDYSKYLNEETRLKIENMTNVFKIDNETKYKIFVSEKINICLNIDEYVIENNLMSDKDLKDISISGKIYVKYLIDNKENINKLILSVLLKPIVTYFIGKDDNIYKAGVIDSIVHDLQNKYNLTYKQPYPSKEMEIINKLIDIVGENIIYKSILNNNLSLLENSYNNIINSEIEDNPFEIISKEFSKEYDTYYKRIGKVYFSDTLYDYENIDYCNGLKEMNKITSSKENKTNVKIKRFYSAKECIDNLINHRILFDTMEQLLLNNSLIEIENMIDRIEKNNIDNDYNKLLQLENKLLPLTEKMWMKTLTHPISYESGNYFNFLVGKPEISKITSVNFLTDRHLKNITGNLKYNYGFIYKLSPNNIIYSSSEYILSRIVDDNTYNEFIVSVEDTKIEIDNQDDSKLLTPEILLKKSIKNNNVNGELLLYNPTPVGIFTVSDEHSLDYEKAQMLSDKYELPLIQINKNLYTNSSKNRQKKYIKEISKSKRSINIKETKKPFSEIIREIRNNLLFEKETEEEFKKTL